MSRIIKKSRAVKIIQIAAVISVISMLALFTVSCKWTIGMVRGSGDIETEKREVSAFSEIEFTGMGNLIITQGEEESLMVEADDNILPLIETDVSGDELTIRFRRGYSFIPVENINFYLCVVDLNKISMSGAGRVDCENLDTDRFEFEISGAGDIDFNINADEIRTKSTGAGNLTLSGKVDSQDIEISGVGKYNAKELESKECKIKISGAGSATVNVSEELDVNISGVGNVYYAGVPVVKQDITGLGRIKSID